MLKSNLQLNRRTWLAWLVLILGLVCTLFAAYIVEQRLIEDAKKRFSFSADQLTQKIHERLHTYEIVLEGCSALFRASDDISRQDWHDYIENLHLEQNIPGTQGIGFNQLIPKDKLLEHIAHVRAEGFLEYRIRPETPRDVYTSIVYIEPFVGKNLNAFGYDTFSEPIRRAAMEKARDTGKPALTRKITLVQEEGNTRMQAGTIMYAPVYQKNMPTKILEQRQKALIGWVSAPYRMDDLMHGILRQWNDEMVDLKIYDGNRIEEASLLFDSVQQGSTQKHPSLFSQIRTINFHGHEWTLLFDTTYTIHPLQNSSIIMTVIIGLILTLLFFGLVLAIQNTTINAKRIADTLTKKIQKSEAQVKKNEAFLQNLIHAMPDLVWLKDKEGTYLTCNSRFESFFGSKKHEIVGKTDYDFVDKATADMFSENDFKVMYSEEMHINEEWITFAHDGHKELLETTKMPIYDDNHILLGVLGIGHDITKRKQTEEMLRKLSIALDQSPASVVITDLNANIEYVNPRFSEITGYSVEEIMHKNPRILQSGEMTKQIYADLWEHLIQGQMWKGELLNKHKNGELYWEEARIAPVKDESGKITHYVAIKLEITKRKQMEEQINQLAFYDVLTHLPNRRLLGDRLAQALLKSTRSNLYGALMFIDLDNFKPLNDHYGHLVGDILLIEVSKRLQQSIRDIDTIARFGGDEFVIILNDLHETLENATEIANTIAEKIRLSLAEPYDLTFQSSTEESQTIRYTCTATLGIVLFLGNQKKQEDLLKWADNAMYQAKEQGKNQIVFFHKGKSLENYSI